MSLGPPEVWRPFSQDNKQGVVATPGQPLGPAVMDRFQVPQVSVVGIPWNQQPEIN